MKERKVAAKEGEGKDEKKPAKKEPEVVAAQSPLI